MATGTSVGPKPLMIVNSRPMSCAFGSSSPIGGRRTTAVVPSAVGQLVGEVAVAALELSPGERRLEPVDVLADPRFDGGHFVPDDVRGHSAIGRLACPPRRPSRLPLAPGERPPMCRLAQFAHTMATGGARCGLCTPAPADVLAPRIRDPYVADSAPAAGCAHPRRGLHRHRESATDRMRRRPVASAPWTRACLTRHQMLTSPPPHMTPDEFRQHGRAVIDWIADYWERIESLPVASTVAPGDIRAMLPDAAPEEAEPFENSARRSGPRGAFRASRTGSIRAGSPISRRTIPRHRCWPTRCPQGSG